MTEPISNIQEEEISNLIQKDFLDYAMNVIVDRALPDVRDGLKPVHRHILYSMHGLGLYADSKRQKSAKIVGDAMGKYHPHGDSSIYEAMVRLGQEFSLRYILVDKKGNFGSIDGDSPAAMRYTEAKMTQLATEMLRDLNKDTVDFIDNYDATEKEPAVLPSRFPNLLVNGSSGIAVGMATNMPPHNLTEIINAIIAYLGNPKITDEMLSEIVKGPDFPTGGIIVGSSDVKEAYRTGKGKITLVGKVKVEEKEKGRPEIVITEIPYGILKPNLIEKIAETSRNNIIEDIIDIRDESNKEGIRIVIELKKDADPQKTIHLLYDKTQLKTSYGIINLAIHKGVPEVMSLKELIEVYVEHQREVIERRSKYELIKSKERAHILEGLITVIQDIDTAIQLIKTSKSSKEAKQKLMSHYNLSEAQSSAVLEIRLQRLTNIEVSALEKEYKELQRFIKILEKRLKNKKMIDEVIVLELTEIVEFYGDERKTEIVESFETLTHEHEVGKKMNLFVTKQGQISIIETEALYKQGQIQLPKLENDNYIIKSFSCTTDDVFILTSKEGKFYRLKVKDIPTSNKEYLLTPLNQFFNNEESTNFIGYSISTENDDYFYFVTKMGMIKKMKQSEVARNGSLVLKINPDDCLVNVISGKENEDLFITSSLGKSIRFSTKTLKAQGRVAGGVLAIKLEKDDFVVDTTIIKDNEAIAMFTDNAFAKKTDNTKYPSQTRGGKGVLIGNLEKKKGNVIFAQSTNPNEWLITYLSNGDYLLISTNDLISQNRTGSGTSVSKDKINHVVKIERKDE